MSNIIIPRKGIDPKAKSGGLMGICEVEFRDALTHKILDREVKKNMLTNGLSSLFNGCPYALDKEQIVGGNCAPFSKQVPVKDYGLGGIFLFPQALGSSADLLYPDYSTNSPTGFASCAEYTQADSRQGAWDGNKSRAITNGWLHVYNWGSNFGNDTIASVALSHRNCYKFFDDMSLALIKQDSIKKDLKNSSLPSSALIGANSKGIYLNSGEGSYGAFPENPKLLRWNKHETKLDLIDDPYSTPAEYDEIWEYPAFGYFCVTEDYIYFVRVTTSAATSEFTLYTIDLSDNSVTSSSYQVVAYLAANGGYRDDVFVKKGNYIYLFKYDYSLVYKIDLTNTANVNEITLPSGISNPGFNGLTLVKGIIIGNGFIINGNDVAVVSPSSNSKIFDSKGVWSVFCSRGSALVGAAILAPYCATHADLSEARVKQAGQELIVSYSILQV